MRDLTPEECEFIAGGKKHKLQAITNADEDPGGELIIVGSPPVILPPPSIPTPAPPPPTGGGYATPGATAAANAFANAHVSNTGTTAADTQHYLRTHDDLAKLYDYAKAHPNDLIDIGNGAKVSFQAALAQITDHVQFVITSNQALSGYNGAQNAASGNSIAIYIDPENWNTHNYDNNFSNNSGEDYEIFHELGHSLNYFNGTPDSFNSEAAANRAGRSIEQQMGVPLLNSGGTLVDPQFGYGS